MYSNGVRVAKRGIFLKHKKAGLMVGGGGGYVIFAIQLHVYFIYFTLCIHNADCLGMFVCVHICVSKAVLSLCAFCVWYVIVLLCKPPTSAPPELHMSLIHTCLLYMHTYKSNSLSLHASLLVFV